MAECEEKESALSTKFDEYKKAGGILPWTAYYKIFMPPLTVPGVPAEEKAEIREMIDFIRRNNPKEQFSFDIPETERLYGVLRHRQVGAIGRMPDQKIFGEALLLQGNDTAHDALARLLPHMF